jgi:hypothetical protein
MPDLTQDEIDAMSPDDLQRMLTEGYTAAMDAVMEPEGGAVVIMHLLVTVRELAGQPEEVDEKMAKLLGPLLDAYVTSVAQRYVHKVLLELRRKGQL